MSAEFRTFFEDLVPGEIHKFGRYEVKREEVIDFARAYDPHEFHLSDEAAANSHFGRLSASGWHTCAMTMRMMVDQMHEKGIASMGGAGVDELRWSAPVYPGDVLRVESELLEKRRSRSRPEMGLIRRRNTVFNQENRAVMSFLVTGMIALRDPSAPFED
ncbi:MaoC family dehydratase [Novosphingobium sp. SG707]|uniref:MaoC family dehydratase n=1 Tax=Novosphingobium sp. SG707 TaxID=2586996 RepID=UPI00144776C1|nr:MaoC family dehydratase [Novosphingobium sp. SG707]NKI99404.1 acyl dehydratase [Novosphingobium sp. SG707]